MLRAIDKKLARDLWQLKGQVLTIALVIACGIASFVTLRTAFDSLVYSRDAYYERTRFADLFAHLESAPRSSLARLTEIPGVALAEGRIVERVVLPMPGMLEPATGTLVSLPAHGRPRLNALNLTSGRLPEPDHSDEAVLLEAFANAHGLKSGGRVQCVINGTLRELNVVGIAMSPEFIFPLSPGQLTYDPRRSAVVWMNDAAVAAAFRMEGAYNDVSFALQPGSSPKSVQAAVDAALGPYGGTGAVLREKQVSHWVLEGELAQLAQLSSTLPVVFLAVAAFLVNVVLSRLVFLQRSQIATLKAVGYSDFEVGLHFLELVVVIAAIGTAIGVASGAYLGRELLEVYTGRFFRFPEGHYRFEGRTAIAGVTVSTAAAVLGALVSVRRVARLPPAEAMKPPAPATYRRILAGGRLLSGLGTATKMVIRELERKPLRSLLSVAGLSMAVAVLVAGRFMYDAIESLVTSVFERSMREDVSVTFLRPVSENAVRELSHVPGVLRAEGLRAVPVRFVSGHQYRDSILYAHPENGELRRVLDVDAGPVTPPARGVALTRTLADILSVRPGGFVRVEIREGARQVLDLPVVQTVDESFGLQGHVSANTLAGALGEERAVNQALLVVDEAARGDVLRRLKRMPLVAGVSSPREIKEQFDAQSGGTLLVMTLVMTLFAVIIAVGVVYNNARVALSARSRDLASLRVLGFTQREIAGILFGEMIIHVVLAIPLGLLVGRWMAGRLLSMTDPETYRFPVFVSTQTYAFAVVVTIAATLLSAALVRRKLTQLDLIGVLKTRE